MNTPETTMAVQTQTAGSTTGQTSSIPRPKKLTPNDKLTLRVVDRLGLPARKWDKAKLQVLQQYGHLIDVKLTGRMCLVGGFDSFEKLERAQAWATDLLSRNDKDVPLQVKLAAAQIVAVCSKEYGELGKRMMEFAEKSAEKSENNKPKNLPPTVALQVNVAGPNSSPASPAPANNGNNGQHLLAAPESDSASSV